MSSRMGMTSTDFPITPHPVLELPTQEQAGVLGFDGFRELIAKREKLIELERTDPYFYGFEPPLWATCREFLEKHQEILILGGNRAGKSEFCAKEIVRTMVNNPGARCVCFQATHANSVEMQQSMVYKYLPLTWKNSKQNKITNIRYTQKNGFSDSTFVGPNGSQCWFKVYSAELSTIEGAEYGPGNACWFDELAPLDWVRTVRFRLITRAARMMISFTPIQGMSPLVREYLTGAVTEEWEEAEMLQDKSGKLEKVPRLQQAGGGRDARIIYFHTQDNAYGGYETLKKTLQGETRANILTRAYGIPQKMRAALFPRWSTAHIVRGDQIPDEGTNYHICDPSNARNFFMIWARVTQDGKIYIYREWPCEARYIPGVGWPGAWAEPDGKKLDGRPGPAQESFGFGLDRYTQELKDLEEETVDYRYMDSRFGASPTPTSTGQTTLIESFADHGLFFEPTPGAVLDEGIALINDYLDYDTTQEVGPLNCPKLYVHEDCKNVHFSLATWGNHDGKKAASKDPIDTIRYLLLVEPCYIDRHAPQLAAGMYW
jgi:phage terminase large subunit-like protein